MTNSSSKQRPKQGPRGGTTTVSAAGMVRKNLWINFAEDDALRQVAFDQRRSQTEVIRAGLRLALRLDPEAAD